jgi:hypothetical protein
MRMQLIKSTPYTAEKNWPLGLILEMNGGGSGDDDDDDDDDLNLAHNAGQWADDVKLPPPCL